MTEPHVSVPDGTEPDRTAPWRLDPPPLPPADGRRRPDPWAGLQPGRYGEPVGEPYPGRRRRPDPVQPDPVSPVGRRRVDSLASPASGRWRVPDGAMSTVAMPVVPRTPRSGAAYEVLRPGRHAAGDAAPSPTGRGAETQPWTPVRPATAETAPWVVTGRARDPGSDTEPVALPPPPPFPVAPDRPSGRHHRPD